jgi:A/G-specific adenine glycosylase
LVLEILLKRTRAETVEKIFPTLVAKYSEPKAIARTSDQELENDLRYLGLYRQRRVALRVVAERILEEYGGHVPLDSAALVSIPHVGLYISNAVLCFCNNQRRPLVDSNVARVLARFHGLDMPKDAREKWLWELSERNLPHKNWKAYNYGMLDLGASVCKKTEPKCTLCCLKDVCCYARRAMVPEL